MDKIKDKGLSNLVKEGQFNFEGADTEVCSCLSDDLTLEEINATIAMAEDILPKIPRTIEKLQELGDRYNSLVFKAEKKRNEEEEATKSGNFVKIILGVGSIVMGVVSILPRAIGLTSQNATTWMWRGLGLLAFGIVLVSLIKKQPSTSVQGKKDNAEQYSAEEEEMKYLQTERAKACESIGVSEDDSSEWESPAINLYARLPILISWLKKMKVIQEDKTLNPSAKMLALAQLFSLLNNEISNAKMLKEKQKQSQTMEAQLKEMKKHSRELEAQNDMLTLQTYNKVSELEGHDPNIVAARTYAHMDQIQNKREKED